MRTNHCKIQGIRKGAAIHTTSGTTLPASIAAVANRGEYQVSMMFDMYIVFADPEYHHLGRLLACLNPNYAGFYLVPPHFICGMENSLINYATNICFKGIIDGVDLHNPLRINKREYF